MEEDVENFINKVKGQCSLDIWFTNRKLHFIIIIINGNEINDY